MAPNSESPESELHRRVFHIVVRPKGDFVQFRTIVLDDGIERLDGRRAGSPSGASWETVAWLIGKDRAHNERGRLVADNAAAQAVLDEGGDLKHVRGDRFKATAR